MLASSTEGCPTDIILCPQSARKRPTVAELLSHPWILKHCPHAPAPAAELWQETNPECPAAVVPEIAAKESPVKVCPHLYKSTVTMNGKAFQEVDRDTSQVQLLTCLRTTACKEVADECWCV